MLILFCYNVNFYYIRYIKLFNMESQKKNAMLPAFRTTEEIHDTIYKMAVSEDRSVGYIINRELSKSLNND